MTETPRTTAERIDAFLERRDAARDRRSVRGGPPLDVAVAARHRAALRVTRGGASRLYRGVWTCGP